MRSNLKYEFVGTIRSRYSATISASNETNFDLHK